MKSSLLLRCAFFLIVIFTSCRTYSQPEKGKFMTSGNISYSRLETTYTYPTIDPVTGVFAPADHNYASGSFSVRPKVGYFLAKNFAAGISLPTTLSGQTYKDAPSQAKNKKATSRSFAVGPFARYYISLSEKAFVFGEVSYTWGSTRTKAPVYTFDNGVFEGENSSTLKQKSGQFQGGAGLAYFLSRNVGLELMVSYQQTRVPSADINPSTNTKGVVCAIGLQVYFGK
jgi:outer membrane protein